MKPWFDGGRNHILGTIHDHGGGPEPDVAGDAHSRAANVSKWSSDVFALQEVGVELLLREGAVGRCGDANLQVAEVWLKVSQFYADMPIMARQCSILIHFIHLIPM